MRATAWGVLAAGVLAPLVRRRVAAPPLALQALAFAAPLGLCVAVRRSRTRDVASCCLQMWAYVAAYKSPHDDPLEQAQRVHIDYPIAIDRALGLGELPTVRLQRALARGGPADPQWRTLDRVLVWTHWSWFLVPHGALLYVLLRHPQRFDRAAVMTYATFDIGAMFYWVLPTAPPWYAARASEDGTPAQDPHAPDGEALTAGTAPPAAADAVESRRELAVRRMMVEYGRDFWQDSWTPLYSVLGGNPLAAMPSLHFATSVMAAQLLAETGPLAGALGWSYAATLGLALVYLGEHYAVDLIAGAALAEAIRRLGPRAGPALRRGGRAVAALEAIAHATS
jgi:PAP2 superfamily